MTEEERRQRAKTAKRYAAPKKERGEVFKFYQAVTGRELTRQEKAKIAEAAVAFRLLLHGFHVDGSMFNGDKPDWVVQVPGTKAIHTVQVSVCRPCRVCFSAPTLMTSGSLPGDWIEP